MTAHAASSTDHPPAFLLPDGPRNALVQMLIYVRDPYRYHRQQTRRYGEVFHMPGLIHDLVITSDPGHLQTLFTIDPARFEPFGTQELQPVIGAGSLLLLGGEAHKRERKLLTPPFHGARMRAYGQLMQDVAYQIAGAWRAGETFPVQPAMQELSLRVILRAVFGLLDGAETARAQQLILELVHSVSPAVLYFTFLHRDFFGLGPWARFLRARRAVDAFLQEHIRARRAQAPGEDILSLLLGARYDDGSAMSDAQVCDELLTLLFAGHETTAIGLSWLLYFVYRQPEVLTRLRAELDALGPDPEPETIAAQPYLEAVCQEALRLYPVVVEVGRRLLEPLELGRYVIPPGHAVLASIYSVHRRPELYPDGESFRPERFLERKFTPFEYLPFGGGHRRCLGAAFAMYEMKLVVHALVGRYDLRPVSERPSRSVLRGLTMGPADGVPMTFLGRRGG